MYIKVNRMSMAEKDAVAKKEKFFLLCKRLNPSSGNVNFSHTFKYNATTVPFEYNLTTTDIMYCNELTILMSSAESKVQNSCKYLKPGPDWMEKVEINYQLFKV